nr:hypothetical protein [Streptococcus gallolyticus]
MIFYCFIIISLFLALVSYARPDKIYRLVTKINQKINPCNEEDDLKVVINALILYYGILFPIVLMAEVICVLLGIR